MRIQPRVDWTDDEQARAVGDAQLALIVLDLMLDAARWLVANREDAAMALGDDLIEELDHVWWTVRLRRNRIAHIRGWIADVGEGHVLVERQSLVISGYPPFHFATGTYWCAQVRGMLAALTWPHDDERTHVEPPKFDESHMPDWARANRIDWRPYRPPSPRRA